MATLSTEGNTSISVMSEPSDQLGVMTAVPLHPNPMVKGGRVFGEEGWEPTL